MPGLIPLMLNPVAAGDRSSVIFSPSQKTKRHSRGQSFNHLPVPIISPRATSFSSSTLPATPRRSSLPPPARARPEKRLSLASSATPSVLPYTTEEWRRTITEVKRQHSNRRYRACFTRCNEILDNRKYTAGVAPVYLIYLHFYAATAMEMCARPLSTPSAYRASLLQQARDHYDHASSLIRDAEESAQSRTYSSFSHLPLSSAQSPSGSTSSRAWSLDTGLSSPTPSVCSSEDLNARLLRSHSPTQPSTLMDVPRLARKKVSFELLKEDLARPELYIRPDSPTLGFDDEYFVTGLSRQGLPEIPSRPKSPLVTSSKIRVEGDEVTSGTSNALYDLKHSVLESDLDVGRQSLQLDSLATRYYSRLSDLKYRVAQHRADLDIALGVPTCSDDEVLDRCPTPFDDENHASERKARIERLRSTGWQRKRFDPSRYEALRNAALAELN